jgi:hypothetical protein
MKYKEMPQAMVPSGRKWPDRRSVIKPSASDTSVVIPMPTSSVTHGETPWRVVR